MLDCWSCRFKVSDFFLQNERDTLDADGLEKYENIFQKCYQQKEKDYQDKIMQLELQLQEARFNLSLCSPTVMNGQVRLMLFNNYH